MSTPNTTFSHEQYESSYPEGGEKHWWPMARNRVVRDFVLDGARPNSALLEVGCGRGFVVKSLRDAGLDCLGVEAATVEPLAGAKSYVRTGLQANQLPAEERRRYDTILLLDVIEHLPNPGVFGRELVRAFPAVSRVVVTVPARPELWSNYDTYFGHFRRYTRATLASFADEAGWTVDRMSYFFHSLYLPTWALANVRGNRTTSLRPPRPTTEALHKLVALGMSAEYRLLPAWFPGTSLIASFRPRI